MAELRLRFLATGLFLAKPSGSRIAAIFLGLWFLESDRLEVGGVEEEAPIGGCLLGRWGDTLLLPVNTNKKPFKNQVM